MQRRMMVPPAPALEPRHVPRDADLASLGALRSLLDDAGRDRVRIGELVAALQDRALPLLVLFFALPNVLPMPPGTSAVLGAPLLLLSVQWALGVGPWLPRMLLNRTVARPAVARWLDDATPWLSHTRPRLAMLASAPCERLAGALGTVLALILLLPIPLGNMPPALAISLLAVGVVRRDGAWVLAGIVVGAAAIAVASGVVWAAVHLGLRLMDGVIGG